MSHSVSNSNQFLSFYNQMDEYFSVVLDLGTYMPYSEKIDQIVQGNYHISPFVKQHYRKLKYFSEMRNQIVHGFRLDHEHYLLASDGAVGAIKNLTEHLITPPTIESFAHNTVPQLSSTDTIQDAIQRLLDNHVRMLPLYEENVYVTTVSLEYLIGLLLKGSGGALLQEKLPKESVSVFFLPPTTSVYTIESLFLKQHAAKPLEVIRISEDGTSATKIVGKITAKDLPKLYQMSILSEMI